MLIQTTKAIKRRAYRARNAERFRIYANKYYKLHSKLLRNRARNYRLKKVYGLSFQEYQDLVQKQNKRCAICGLVRKLYIDHDHETNQVRGLLCLQCNTRLDWSISQQQNIKRYLYE